jgi:hypothetical protein
MNDPVYDTLVQAFLPFYNAVYNLSGVGHCCHIVLDDDNCDDESIRWCEGYACANECQPCRDALRFLGMIDERFREHLVQAVGGISDHNINNQLKKLLSDADEKESDK